MPNMTGETNNQLNVKKQVVAGFVIFRRTDEGIKFLLLYRRGNYWNFPKGHFEAGETSFKAALRETEEETGLKYSELRIIPNFRTYVHFSFQRGNEKIQDKMILYLAETRNPNVTIRPREHSGFAWFLYADAMRTVGKKFVSTKRVLKQANDFILHKRGLLHRQKDTERKGIDL
jgi:bis(5'-nucleosidyl)-tetraphosphatase